MSSEIKCKTLVQRLKCAYYKEKDDYVKNISLLFERILKRYSLNPSLPFLTFIRYYSRRSYTGPRYIDSNDKISFRDFCIACFINLDVLISTEKISKISDPYIYKWKVKGKIGGILHRNKDYILQFSFHNASDTQNLLDFYSLNSYIYNVFNRTTMDTVVMSVPTNCFFLVKYDKSDYTMKRGFIKCISSNRMRVRGDHCLTCKNQCKPTFINGLDRLTASI